jgi:exopolyphosphatase/guanosine-5'-triphosphate,3'-diphosphate pyrophosphatase
LRANSVKVEANLAKTGVIDVGSNTIRLSVYEHGGGGCRLLARDRTVAGLARFMADGELSPAGEDRLLGALARFAGVLDGWKGVRVHAFATASLRYADNAARVVEKVRAETGIGLDILSGEEEARLGFIGARSDTGIRDGMVVDIGGASCEFTSVSQGAATEFHSIHIGCLSIRPGVVDGDAANGEEVARMRATVREGLRRVGRQLERSPELLCFVGGTARNVRKIARELLSDKSHEITEEDVALVAGGLEERDVNVRAALRRVAPERCHTMLPGVLIMEEILTKARAKKLTVSGYGVREGYLIDRVIGGASA